METTAEMFVDILAIKMPVSLAYITMDYGSIRGALPRCAEWRNTMDNGG